MACRAELPRLQKLIDQYKDRADVQFISLNMDANPGLAQPVMKELGLSFVFIPAISYLTEKLNLSGIPANWIVDANGVVRLKGTGYEISGKWETGMKDAIEKVKLAAPATSPAGVSK